MDQIIQQGADAAGEAKARSGVAAGVVFKNHYHFQCFGPDGKLKWEDGFDNLVTTVGLNDNLTKYFKGSSYTAAWYVGLTTGSPTFANGDTAASHTGWTESSAYSEAVRQTLTLGTASGGSIDNSAAKATFSINANATLGGAFVISDNTKGGTTGTLYGGGAFSAGNKSLNSGDTLQVTITLTAVTG
jgi:hypothetical protein